MIPRQALATTLLAAVATIATQSATAAADPPPPLDESPRGAGTETGAAPPGAADRVHEGAEAGMLLGTGFSSVYGVGMSGRLGYSFRPGVYAGGAFTQYVGSGSRSATFLGAEGGYEFFPAYHWELRPYAFLGPAFVNQPSTGSDVSLALQPSVLGAYHFGPWFLTADARVYVVPNPASIALLGGAGVGF